MAALEEARQYVSGQPREQKAETSNRNEQAMALLQQRLSGVSGAPKRV